MKFNSCNLGLMLLVVSSSLFKLHSQNCSDPNSTFEFVSATGTIETDFCEGPNGEVTVDITVDQNNDPACINFMKLDWGDGTTMMLSPTDFGNFNHFYNFPDSIACELTALDLNPLVTLTLVFLNGKINIRSQSLTIHLLPRASIVPMPPFCVNEPVEFNMADSCYIESVLWDFGNGQTSTAFAPTFTWNTPGLKLVELCVTNDCGTICKQQSIFIREKPDVSAINFNVVPGSGCIPVESTITAAVAGVDDYDWSVTPLIPCSGCFSFIPATGIDSIQPVVRFTKEGTYTIQLIGKNPCGRDTLTKLIQVFAPPNVSLSSSPSGCKTLSYTPDVTYNNLNPGSITNYQWSFPRGSPTVFNGPNPANIQYLNNGDTLLVDTVILTVTGPCGTQTYSTIVRVYGNTTVQFSTIGQVCTGDAAFAIPVTPPPPVGDFTFVPPLPAGAFNPTTGVLIPALLPPGNYAVNYKVSVPGAPAGCESEGDASFTVVNSIQVDITVPDLLCVDAPPLTFGSNPTTGGMWTGQGITNMATGQYSAAQAGVGPDTVWFSFPNLSGCISRASHILEIVGVPQVTSPDTLFSCDVLQGISIEALGAFVYSPGMGTKTWAGPGVDPQTGVFTSPGVGTYNITLNYDINPACDTTVAIVIQVDSFIAAVAGLDATVCQSQGSVTLTGWPGGGVWSGTPNIDPATGVIDLAAEPATPHSYFYTIRAGTPCESSDEVQVTIVPGDGVTIGQSLDYICETAATYTLPNANPPGGVWSGPFVTGSIVDVSALSPDTFSYTYTVSTLPAACNNIAFNLIVTAQPSADFDLSQDTACIGNSITVIPLTTGAGMNEVNWGDGNTDLTLSHEYALEGDYPVTLTVTTQHPLTGAPLCSNNSSENIHIIAPPQVLAFTMDSAIGCAPLLVTFTNQSIAENGQFLWDFGNGVTFLGQQPGPVLFQQGTEDTIYTVRLTVLTGCDSLFFERTVTVLPQPHANFGITYDEPCSGGILEINNTSTGNPANNLWTTNLSNLFSTFNPPNLQFFADSLPLMVDITLRVFNQCGADSVTKSVTVNPSDVIALINISDTTEVCVGDTVTLTSFSTPGASIYWKTSDGNTFLQNSLKVSFPQEGIYKVTLYAEGCGYDSMDMYVRVQPLPSLAVQHPQIICPGDTALFKIMTNAPGSLLYFGTGDSSQLITASYRYLQTGIYPLSAIATSLIGCKQVWNGSIEIAPKPEALAELPDSVCSGAPVLLQSTSLNNLTCVWAFGDGNFDDQCSTIHMYPTPGLFNASLTVISSIGCRDTVLVPVYVRSTPSAVPIFQYLERCTPASVLFSSQSVGATSLTWDFGDGSAAGVSPFTKIYGAGGIYLVRLIATNEGICTDTGAVMVELWQTPQFELELIENCVVAEGTDLAILTPAGNLPTITGPGYQQDGNFHAGLVQGYYDVSIISPDGCQNDTTVFIPKPGELLLKVTEDSFDIKLGETIQLDAVVNQLGVTFNWTPGLWLENDTLAGPVAAPIQDISYVVLATSLNGCTKTDTVWVSVKIERDSGLYIPDIITPNDDGINDIFYVRSINPSVDHIEAFKVLDQYGEILHDVTSCPAEQIAFGWDGTFKAQKAEMGVYRYQLVVVYKDGVSVPKSGLLMLAR